MELTFEQAEARLTPARRAQLARLMWEDAPLPQDLSEAEKAFCFGLYVYEEYEQREILRSYFEQPPQT